MIQKMLIVLSSRKTLSANMTVENSKNKHWGVKP